MINNVSGYILGGFFTNSSGHPGICNLTTGLNFDAFQKAQYLRRTLLIQAQNFLEFLKKFWQK
jgi:hypothetical protein